MQVPNYVEIRYIFEIFHSGSKSWTNRPNDFGIYLIGLLILWCHLISFTHTPLLSSGTTIISVSFHFSDVGELMFPFCQPNQTWILSSLDLFQWYSPLLCLSHFFMGLLEIRAFIFSSLIHGGLFVFLFALLHMEVRGQGSTTEQHCLNWWEFSAFSRLEPKASGWLTVAICLSRRPAGRGEEFPVFNVE